jgi:predicted nucleic acid-binding protein
VAIHIDTSFAIRALVPGSPEDRTLREWIATDEDLVINAVAWAEFLCGPLEPDDLRAMAYILGEPIPFTSADASRAAELFNQSGRRRGSFGDCLIAASALNAGATLATSNPADFNRFPDLAVFGRT